VITQIKSTSLPNSNADVRIINHEQAIALSKTPKLLGRQKEALLLGILWLFSDPALRVSIKGEEKRDLPSFWKNARRSLTVLYVWDKESIHKTVYK
jgi:hypothetical protein